MPRTLPATAALLLLIIFASFTGYAQSINKATLPDTLTNRYPKALLIQLRSEHNRMLALTRQGDYKDLEILKNDATNIASRMIADFRDHFNFCQVYYYIDTNLELVEARQFKDVLYNLDGTPAAANAISDTANDYLIAYYGYSIQQSRNTDSVTDVNTYRANTEPTARGLVINNSNMQQVAVLYRYDYLDLIDNKKEDKPYRYSSKHYDMQYFPFAKILNVKLRERQKNIGKYNYTGGYLKEKVSSKK